MTDPNVQSAEKTAMAKVVAAIEAHPKTTISVVAALILIMIALLAF